MLKALELIGFKSFADKTRIEFPPGITVVVGPNGSGKSNIVDAMKWVLGETRARSLRGKEMADVIFKGSGNGSRKPANTAEATIIFDNAEGQLALDVPEVHVTRRVYRSGEGEYLINNEPCRLKDIKDLFRGTGVGTDAYSLIEQGKVDTLLQASPRERRAIFEEAAGISRFKAKKVESQRRLDRVDQNLLRLSDIVEEVDTRLRRLKSQATKARRYKEYTDRLQELRTQVGQVDWRRLSEGLAAAEGEAARLAADIKSATDTIADHESASSEMEYELSRLDEERRACDAKAAADRQIIARHESTLKHESAHLRELDDLIQRGRAKMLAMSARAGDLNSELNEVVESLEVAAKEHETLSADLSRLQAELETVTRELAGQRQQREDQRLILDDRLRERSDVASQLSSWRLQQENAEAAMARFIESLSELQSSAQQAEEELAAYEKRQKVLAGKFEECGQQLAGIRDEMQSGRTRLGELNASRANITRDHVAVSERIAVLEEIEKRLEGVGTGVQEVLRRKSAHPTGPFGGVRGMVADLIQVKESAVAHMIEVTLGERAQHLVVAGSKLFDKLASDGVDLPGRVAFMRLESTPSPRDVQRIDLNGQSGVIGRADRFVTSDAEYDHVVSWLLGDTWFVATINDALAFRRSLPDPPRFTTQRGELLDEDGRVFVGPLAGATGLISRRAELADLRQRLVHLDEKREAYRKHVAAVQGELTAAESRAAKIAQTYDEVAQELSDVRAEGEASRERVKQLRNQVDNAAAEHNSAEQMAANAKQQLETGTANLHVIEADVSSHEVMIAKLADQSKELERHRDDREQTVTAIRVTVAKSEQRVEAFQAHLQQLRRDHQERQTARDDVQAELDGGLKKRQQSQQIMLAANSELAHLYINDEVYSDESKVIFRLQDEVRRQRSQVQEEIVTIRQQLKAIQQQQHLQHLEAERLRHERTTLSDRLKEDYGIEVAQLQSLQLSEEQAAARDEIDSEIGVLHRKISNIGSVNMDALVDLEDLEERSTTLTAQYQDMIDAKEALERIINRINADSRLMFTETLDAIRSNFTVLFRKVFGGGHADIVLEEGVDMLEGGIDVIATPPGKNSLGLSLLSGGEKALTAVTLLLAIFQYRPSPFCVLDEVDGPLDESNIGRFVDVLNEFLQWTKFVVVTHSKKTMTAAHTLYGITMQESGVSKRVSVKFEDVSEDGEIVGAVTARNEKDPPSEDDDEQAA